MLVGDLLQLLGMASYAEMPKLIFFDDRFLNIIRVKRRVWNLGWRVICRKLGIVWDHASGAAIMRLMMDWNSKLACNRLDWDCRNRASGFALPVLLDQLPAFHFCHQLVLSSVIEVKLVG